MAGIILIIITGFACFYGIRYVLLKRSIRGLSRELAEITENLEANRIVKLPSPQRDLEELEAVLNHTLEQIRQERISYEKREREFQKQLEDLSHDLRTPLTAIQGYLKLMNQESLGREEKEYLEVIQRRTSNLQHLINQFYEFSTLLSGDYKMELREVDFGRMCREQILGSFSQLEAAGIKVKVQIPEKPVLILADENALSRIIGNLLQNAIRYAKKHLEIEMKEIKVSETEKETVLICANDTEDMGADVAEKLFQRFYTGEKARSHGGTGLGLAISRQLAEQMGGVMTVERKEIEGRGAEDGRAQADGMKGIAVGNKKERKETWLVFKIIFKI